MSSASYTHTSIHIKRKSYFTLFYKIYTSEQGEIIYVRILTKGFYSA